MNQKSVAFVFKEQEKKDYCVWLDGMINRKKKTFVVVETIPEYICQFLMSLSLKQYFRSVVLSRGVEGSGLGMKGDWAGIQAKEPRLKVIRQTMSPHGTKVESITNSLDKMSIQQEERQSPMRGQQDNWEHQIWERFKREDG